MAPVQRPIHIKNLFVEIVKCFKKAGEEEILESMQRTHEICHEISLYANDMMKAGRIVGCPVSTVPNESYRFWADLPLEDHVYTANVYRQMTDKLMFNSVISTVRWIKK